jgi:hypothetical protein
LTSASIFEDDHKALNAPYFCPFDDKLKFDTNHIVLPFDNYGTAFVLR